MKILSSLFLLPALICAAPAARAQSMSFEKLDGTFDAAALEFRTGVILDRAPAGALARVESAYDVLAARAARWQLYFEDIEDYVEATALARMEEEIAALDELVANGQLTSRPRYEQMVSVIRRICARTIELVQAPNMRPRLFALLAGMRDAAERGLLSPAHVQLLRAHAAAAGFELSMRRIARHEADGTLLPLEIAFQAERLYRRGGFGRIRPVPRGGLHVDPLP
jgi:hypothetical protein